MHLVVVWNAALHHTLALCHCMSGLCVCNCGWLHMHWFHKRLLINVPVEVLACMRLSACECVCVSLPQTIQSPVCLNPAPFFLTPSTHTGAHTHTHGNRWLILTEIIRQQSHQHGSVVIRVWTQCLFSSRNGRSAWCKRREMHYSP